MRSFAGGSNAGDECVSIRKYAGVLAKQMIMFAKVLSGRQDLVHDHNLLHLDDASLEHSEGNAERRYHNNSHHNRTAYHPIPLRQ